MSEEMEELRIETEGMTVRELEELESLIIASTPDAEIRRVYPPLGRDADGRFSIQASAAGFDLIVLHPVLTIAVPALTAGATAFGRKVGSAIGDVVANHIKKRFAGKSNVTISAKLSTPKKKAKRIIEGKR